MEDHHLGDKSLLLGLQPRERLHLFIYNLSFFLGVNNINPPDCKVFVGVKVSSFWKLQWISKVGWWYEQTLTDMEVYPESEIILVTQKVIYAIGLYYDIKMVKYIMPSLFTKKRSSAILYSIIGIATMCFNEYPSKL